MRIPCCVLVVLIFAAFGSINDVTHPMLLWADRHNVKRDFIDVKVFEYPNGLKIRGLAAAADIGRGQVIVSIPDTLQLWSERPPVASRECVDLWEKSDGFHKMVVSVLVEYLKGADSIWSDWIETVPTNREFSQFFPYAAPMEIQKAFSALPMMQIFRQYKAEMKDFILESRSCFGDQLSQDDYLWAECIVWSRSSEENEGAFLVPILDFANTGDWLPSGSNAEFRVETVNGTLFLQAVAVKKVELGEEILVDYSVYNSPRDTLSSFGFLPENVPLDRVDDRLDRRTCEKLYPAIERYLPKAASDHKCKFSRLACNLAKVSWESCKYLHSFRSEL